MIDYSYLCPPKKVYHTKLPLDYIYQQKDGKPKRRIFKRSYYEEFQKQAIQKLKDYLSLKAPNVSYTDELLLRFNYAGHFLFSEITEKVKAYDQWHQNELIVTINKFARQILQNGHLYSFGRDYDYCPLIILRPSKIDLKKYEMLDYLNATANLLAPLEEHMLVGGVIEKWNVLIDFENGKYSGALSQYQTYINKIIQAYPCRLKRVFFVNMHTSSQPITKRISELLKNHDDQISFQHVSKMDALNKYISHDEREIKYGGSHSNICEFWPIQTTNKLEQSQLEDRTQYASADNDQLYFQDPKVPLCDMIGSKCEIY